MTLAVEEEEMENGLVRLDRLVGVGGGRLFCYSSNCSFYSQYFI